MKLTDLDKKQLTALTLGGFTLIGTGLLAVTHALTAPLISQSQAEAFNRTLSSLLPENSYQRLSLVNHPDGEYWQAQDAQGNTVALVIKHQTSAGYNGQIELLSAYQAQGVLATRVTQHQETPGLGDGIEARKSRWIEQFSPEQALPARLTSQGGQIDSLTGATITSQAVTEAVNQGFARYQRLVAQPLESTP